VTHETFGRLHRQKVGSLPPDLVLFSCDFCIRDVVHPFFSDSYLLHGVNKLEKRKVQCTILTLFTGSIRILVAYRGTTRLFSCFPLLGWRGTATISVATKWDPSHRIGVRNGPTRPARDINVNYPPYTQRPSSKEILNENLLRFANFPTGTSPLRVSLQQFHGVRPRMRRSPSHTVRAI
jgi:hypothetical protein